MKGTVGASIVSIITESLYDKPIIVFREYIQNAADALENAKQNRASDILSAHIWIDNNSLFFLDNGTGIGPTEFETKMTSIASSGKIKTENIGYKGIGRLSGLSYCNNLTFINIIDYANTQFQEYSINGEKYSTERDRESFKGMTFQELMAKIGTLNSSPNVNRIKSIIGKRQSLFASRNTGFLVILEDITPVLNNTIKSEDFLDNLKWLLPVPFSSELKEQRELFDSLGTEPAFEKGSSVPAKYYNIFYNDSPIERPLSSNMLRKYLCRCNMDQYAVCVHAFSNKKIEIERNNPFSGIRIYIDNMLLCDENELIPALQQYGLTNHGLYELIQTVKGIGAMIYIVDKVNISANARRTFIDVTDEDSLCFLRLLAEFVNNIYQARYALSGYASAKRKEETTHDKLSDLKSKALKSLETLARDEIVIDEEPEEANDFDSLSISEKKRIIKNRISKEINSAIKRYLAQTDEFDPDTCFIDFKTWLDAN